MYYDRLKKRVRNVAAADKRRREAIDAVKAMDVTQHIAPPYQELHRDVVSGNHTIYNLPGGRGSGKSSFASLEVVNGVMSDPTGQSNAIVFRRVSATLRESAFSQIAWAIDTLGVGHLWKPHISPMQYTYLPTGAVITFRGLDDPLKLKSIKPAKGYFRFIWFEEFSELPGPNLARSVSQSVMRGGDKFSVFRSFNPPISRNNWVNTFIKEPDERAITFETNYTMMPPEWLGESFIYEAERLKEVNPLAYEHEYLGVPTGTGGEVFPNLEVREITTDEIDGLGYMYNGLDFGFAVDPASFIRLAYDRKHETIYLLDEIYKRGLSNAALADEIKKRGYNRGPNMWFDSLEGTVHQEDVVITCDAAEPKSIADLRQSGLKASACYKKPGCVQYRVKWLQHRKIVIDPARTPNAYREFVNYQYATDKDGNLLSDLPDKDNHTIDATAYALNREIFHTAGLSA